MEQWISHTTLMWLSIGSGLALLIGALTVPWIIINLPENFFARPDGPGWLDRQPAAIRLPLRIGKNLIAVLLVVLGVAMLVLPGQGILSILLGIVLADVPGKMRLLRWIFSRPKVTESANWLRRKFGRPPLRTDWQQVAA
ncbi:MAG TPA: hypothetical protein VFS39_07515 [Nitrospira sp.]|nr:hypothetical protein [Nitrospira sp.]